MKKNITQNLNCLGDERACLGPIRGVILQTILNLDWPLNFEIHLDIYQTSKEEKYL